MNTEGSTTLVRGVRTFADDVRRAHERGGATETEHVKKPAEPVVEPTAPPASAPQPTPQPAVAPQRPAQPSAQPDAKPAAQAAPTPPQNAAIKPLKPQQAEDSHLSDEGKLFDIRTEAGDVPQEGTIVKDTRRNKWSLSRALGDSIKEWVGDQKESLAEHAKARNPKPAVAPSDTRTRVIQAARTQSALAPKDDHSAVVERLRTFARDAERVTGKKYTMTPKRPAEEKPEWGHVDDTSSPDSTAGHARSEKARKPSSIKRGRTTLRPARTPAVPQKRATPPPMPPKNIQGDVAPTAERTLADTDFAQLKEQAAPQTQYATSDTAPTAEKQPVLPPEDVRGDVAPQVATRSEKEETEAERHAREAAIEKLLAVAHHDTAQPAPAATPEPPAPSRDIPFEKPATNETGKLRTYRDDAIEDVQAHQRSIPAIAAAQETRRVQTQQPKASPTVLSPRPFIIGGIAVALLMLTFGFGFFFMSDRGADTTPTVVRTPDFIEVGDTTTVPFSTNRARLLTTLEEAVARTGSGVTYIYPTYTEGGGPVSTSDFMFVLDPRAPGSFIRNLSEQMMFGSVDSAPFFILRTEQYDTAYAGMLDWESFMSADLTPLFGAPVRATYDPTARTQDQTRAAFFVDQVVANVDVRVLYDEDGDERIIYAFLDRETVVITTSTSALRALIERYR